MRIGIMGDGRLTSKESNAFIIKNKRQNGKIDGEQSLHNKRLFLFYFNEEQDDFVGEWVDNPYINSESIIRRVYGKTER